MSSTRSDGTQHPADAAVYAWPQESNTKSIWSLVQKAGGAVGLPTEVSAHGFTLYANLSSLPP